MASILLSLKINIIENLKKKKKNRHSPMPIYLNSWESHC